MNARIVWRGAEAKARERAAAARALNEAAAYLLGEAQDIAPIEEGTLVMSGNVGMASPSDLAATVNFGGGASDYAVKQHEDLTLRHDAGRSGKYLEKPLNELRPKLPRFIADRLKAAL